MGTIPKPASHQDLIWINNHWVIDSELGTITSIRTGNVLGSPRPDGYEIVRVPKGRQYYVHHLIWWKYYGQWPTMQLDHDDRKKYNNRVDNLLEVTHSGQMHNRTIKPGKYGEGVEMAREGNAYNARINYKGHKAVLRRCSTPEEASVIYQHAKAAIKVMDFIDVFALREYVLNGQGH